ncbi:MAG: hypothetical protein WA148_02330 [Actinomycetota bacterium]
MKSFFEKPELFRAENYKGYFLSRNPLKPDESLVNLEGEDDLTRFRRMLCAREAEKVSSPIKGEAFEENPKGFWLVKDQTVGGMFNIMVQSGIFRDFVISENPRLFPVYIPFPQIFGKFFSNVYSLMVDRLLPDYFRNCVYSFAYQELKGLVERGEDKQILPDLGVPGFLKEMDETKGEVLDVILFPPKPEEELAPVAETSVSEEESKEEPPPVAETSVSEEEPPVAETSVSDEEPPVAETSVSDEEPPVAEASASEPEEAPADPRKDMLINFIETRSQAEGSGFTTAIQEAIFIGLREGFENGRSKLTMIANYGEAIPSLLHLISFFYHKTVLFVDQLDMWPFVPKQEKASFLGDATQLKFLSGGQIVFLFITDADAYKAFDESFSRGYEKISLDLSLIGTDISTLNTPEVGENVLVSFLQADAAHEGKELQPFTADGVAELVSRSSGNIVKGLEMAASLIEKGKSQGFPPIDKKFVSNNIS